MTNCGLPLWITIDGHEPSDGLGTFLDEVRPYGVILFARHLKNTVQVKSLNSFISQSCSRPLIGLDQEGGRVSRLKAMGLDFEGAADASGDPERVKRNSARMAEVLSELGFDVDFAPVVDIGPAEAGTGLEGRGYSPDKLVVIDCARAFLEGLKEFGIMGCLKHFPGLGGSKVDSHRSLPFVQGDSKEREDHLSPYRELHADFAMVAHSSYQFLENGTPSSLNPETYSMLKEIGCCDKIVTDDLSMGALKGFGDLPSLAEMSLRAGADIAMAVCKEEETRSIASRLKGGGG
jgi:beta-N-acetylhexosaminidase